MAHFLIKKGMEHFNENASVIYTDDMGKQIDTFVVFETDHVTGLTHINHQDLRVPAERLTLHAKTICQYHLPLEDAFSFQLLKKLKEKHRTLDTQRKTVVLQPKKSFHPSHQLAKAS